MTRGVPRRLTFSRGFTLTGIAIVLVIVAILLGSMMIPIATQMDLRDSTEAQKVMGDIREALIGYAASRAGKPYLPCPDTDGDGIEQARVGSACPADEGDVPWNTLGLGRQDPWNRAYRYRVTPAFSNSAGFLLTSAGTLRLCTDNACGTTVATSIPAVILSKGKNGTLPAGVNVNEDANSDLNNDFVSKTPDPDYDDLVIWLSPNVLFNRMVAAGRLP